MARSRSRSRETPPETPPTWDEKLIQGMSPYRLELVGVVIAVAAFITLLGLPGLIRSQPIRIWSSLWLQFAGWGAYIFNLSFLAFGVHLAIRNMGLPYRVKVTQVVGFELILLATLPLSYQLSAGTLAAAYTGRNGGLIGWALAQPLLELLGPVLTGLTYLVLLLWGIALLLDFTWREAHALFLTGATTLRRWANQIEADTPPRAAPTPPAVDVTRPTAPVESRSARRSRLLPPLNILEKGVIKTMSASEIEERRSIIEQTLRDFGLVGKVTSVRCGPAITQFGVTPGYLTRTGPDGEDKDYKVRVGQIAALHKDFALALAVPRLRIEAPVPGKGVVGIEVPNQETATVRLRTVIADENFKKLDTPLAVALGLDVSGTPRAVDLGKMPHLLIAGTTGSGKSVFINALISCLIFNNTPETLNLIMIDPKKVELVRFNGLPHLLGTVEVEHERIIGVLGWITAEMDRRYQAFAEAGAKDLHTYNRLVPRFKDTRPFPHIVVFIDELADLMAMYPADIEKSLCRLAQMARATGIHLVVATQRPSTDVITGLIKANFPARCSFAVASNVDSRVILDGTGADSLLGQGDMLFLAPDASVPARIQGCFVSDAEIDQIVTFWQSHWRTEQQEETVARYEGRNGGAPWDSLIARQNLIDTTDDMLERAIEMAQKYDNLSTSALQRRLRIGFPRAARLMEALHEMGLVEDPQEGGRTRRSYVDEDDDDPLGSYLDRLNE